MLDDPHVSVDIEACGEVLMSLGACTFDPRTGEAASEYYGVPDIGQQVKKGLRLDADAFRWWLKQSDEARGAVGDPKSTKSVLKGLREVAPAWGVAVGVSDQLRPPGDRARLRSLRRAGALEVAEHPGWPHPLAVGMRD
jgi:hypothetical protein